MSRTLRDGETLPRHGIPADAAGAPPAHAEALDSTDAARQRLHRLFRDTLRHGEINPLLHLLLRRLHNDGLGGG